MYKLNTSLLPLSFFVIRNRRGQLHAVGMMWRSWCNQYNHGCNQGSRVLHQGGWYLMKNYVHIQKEIRVASLHSVGRPLYLKEEKEIHPGDQKSFLYIIWHISEAIITVNKYVSVAVISLYLHHDTIVKHFYNNFLQLLRSFLCNLINGPVPKDPALTVTHKGEELIIITMEKLAIEKVCHFSSKRHNSFIWSQPILIPEILH